MSELLLLIALVVTILLLLSDIFAVWVEVGRS
jgi:hypothetical protein